MKTTIDIPDDLLKSMMKRTGSKTIRGAMIAAIESYLHREGQRDLVKHLGTFKDFMTIEELQAMREERDKRHDDRRQQLMDRSASRKRELRRAIPRRKSA
jgi:Arc/MetJ family transcription regulator